MNFLFFSREIYLYNSPVRARITKILKEYKIRRKNTQSVKLKIPEVKRLEGETSISIHAWIHKFA